MTLSGFLVRLLEAQAVASPLSGCAARSSPGFGAVLGVDARRSLRSIATMTCLGACAAVFGANRAPLDGRTMPAEFRDDRVFLVVPEGPHRRLTFYTDSGGGYNAIAASTAGRLALLHIGVLAAEVGQDPLPLVAFPDALTTAGVPVSDYGGPFQGGLVVVPDPAVPFGHDGFLGARWFDGHVWAFDYGAGTLRSLERGPPASGRHRIALAFRTDAAGRRTTSLARMPVTIDGESLEMLLDTGATVTLTARSAATFDRDPGARVGASFIVRSVFARWVARHPDWRVIPAADAVGGDQAPMIEVPTISIAGWSVGPVWFAVRADRNFRIDLASMMDRPVDGAIGGSAFRYLRMTIDYRHAVADFARPSVTR